MLYEHSGKETSTFTVDIFGKYAAIPDDHRKLVENRFGYKRVLLALSDMHCKSCGIYTSNFNIMTCSRACDDCWSCRDSGEKGNDGNHVFGMCSVNYAQTNFLLTRKEVHSLHILQVNDVTLANGCTNRPELAITLVEDAKALSWKKWGGLIGLQRERSSRSEKVQLSWKARCEAVDKNGKSQPKQPRVQDTFTYNFVTRNQRSRNMHAVCHQYGLYRDMFVREALTAPPTIVVSDRSEQQIRSEYQNARLQIYDNLMKAYHASSPGSTLIVDKVCDLRKEFATMHPPDDWFVCRDNDITAAGENQNHTLMIGRSTHGVGDRQFIGTKRGEIISNNSCFYVTNCMVHLKNIKMKIVGLGDSPGMVIANEGRALLEGCTITNQNNGYCILAHGPTHMYRCVLRTDGFGTLHSEEKGFGEYPSYIFKNNIFAGRSCSANPMAFFTGDMEVSKEFWKNLSQNNSDETSDFIYGLKHGCTCGCCWEDMDAYDSD